mmetsp:Transcript_71403/g.83070  ORF Transcript_71403/g.83070 Transcript_71403/m.83070 type:complete len:224 (-) Transcript_71403:19-690(-)
MCTFVFSRENQGLQRLERSSRTSRGCRCSSVLLRIILILTTVNLLKCCLSLSPFPSHSSRQLLHGRLTRGTVPLLCRLRESRVDHRLQYILDSLHFPWKTVVKQRKRVHDLLEVPFSSMIAVEEIFLLFTRASVRRVERSDFPCHVRTSLGLHGGPVHTTMHIIHHTVIIVHLTLNRIRQNAIGSRDFLEVFSTFWISIRMVFQRQSSIRASNFGRCHVTRGQ